MNEILTGISETEYRALKYESFSSIKHILTNPKMFLYYKEKPFLGSPATMLGTCIHHYLQGNRHLVAFKTLPKLKKNLEAIAEFEQSFNESTNGEGIIVPQAFEAKLEQIMKNFNEAVKVSSYLENIEIEVPFLFDIDSVTFKGKVDGINKLKDATIEIKSTSQATNALDFRWEAQDRHYDMQAYMYLQATKTQNHFFIVVNTTEPYYVNIYKSSPAFLESGKKKAYVAAERYRRHILNGEPWDDSGDIEEI